MTKETSETGKPVITATFAHYCGPWEWQGPHWDRQNYVMGLMAERGYEMIVPDFRIGDPSLTLDEAAQQLTDLEKEHGADEYIRVGHSFGGDIIYRNLGATPVSLAVFLAAPLRPAQKRLGYEVDNLDQSISYGAFVEAEKNNLIDFEREREYLGSYLFRDIGDLALRSWSISRLRPHPHRPKTAEDDSIDDKALLDEKTPMVYLGCENDKILSAYGQRQIARRLGVEFTSIPTGHFPMLEKPALFVERLIAMIETKKHQRQLALKHRESGLTPNGV